MLKQQYANWMYEWETRLTTRDENRVVRPLEWGFEWIEPFLREHGFAEALPGPEIVADPALAEAAMVLINQFLIRHSDTFFGYKRPTDFRLEERHPELFPTNVRPETLAQDAALKQQAAEGKMPKAQFLRFTSPERTPLPGKRSGECPLVSGAAQPRTQTAPAGHHRDAAVECRRLQPQLALHHLQQDGHLRAAALAALPRHSPASRAGALRLRGQRQHWPHAFGLPPGGGGHSLLRGLAGGAGLRAIWRARHQPGLLLRLFGQRSRRAAARERLQPRVHGLWRCGLGRAKHAPRQAGAGDGRALAGSHPRAVGRRQPLLLLRQDHAPDEVAGPEKKVLLVYANYDLTFPKEYSLKVVKAFRRIGLNFEKRVLPCGHYTTGETPYKFIDGWYMGSFVYRAFKALRSEKTAGLSAEAELSEA